MAVRKGILPSNSKSLWKAVKIAKKNISHTPIPSNMKINNTAVAGQDVAEQFASFLKTR